IDRFDRNYIIGQGVSTFSSNYVYGNISKEAQKLKQWKYNALAELYFSGPAMGNFILKGNIGKDIKEWLGLHIGVMQNLSNAPFSFTQYKTSHYERNFDLNPISITNINGALSVPKYQLYIKANNYVMANYVYFNEA